MRAWEQGTGRSLKENWSRWAARWPQPGRSVPYGVLVNAGGRQKTIPGQAAERCVSLTLSEAQNERRRQKTDTKCAAFPWRGEVAVQVHSAYLHQ